MSNNEIQRQTPATTAIASSADNVAAIVSDAPKHYLKNRTSHDNCLAACGSLLDAIRQTGMTDELDKKAATYIERTRRTVRAMSDLRSPVTKMFDWIRSEFTTLENDIDPTKAGTIPYQLQQLRNQYAARKREEEEARRRAEEARRQAQAARDRYRTDCEENYKTLFNNHVVSQLNALTRLVDSVTLDNYQTIYDTISGISTSLSDDWLPTLSVRMPLNLTPDESRAISNEVLSRLRSQQFVEQYCTEIADYRQEILDRLPSRKAELERVARASAEEARRIQEEMRLREEAERARKEAERAAREEEEARRRAAEKVAAEAGSLFAEEATRISYTPKAKVSKKIRITDPKGYLQVLMMWWTKEGSTLPDAELAKIFRKQITFCERLANKEGECIVDPSIIYVDEVKAQ